MCFIEEVFDHGNQPYRYRRKNCQNNRPPPANRKSIQYGSRLKNLRINRSLF
jgi:hypothetical protein